MVRRLPIDEGLDGVRLEILANLSMTLDRLAGFFLVLSAVTLMIALLPTLMGFWPVLVVAVIHLAIVGWCFRLAWRGNWARERIEIGPEITLVEHAALHERSSSRWPTAWLKVEVDRSGREPRIFVSSHGRRQELARFVPPDERLEAARLLDSGLRPFSALNHGIQAQASSG